MFLLVLLWLFLFVYMMYMEFSKIVNYDWFLPIEGMSFQYVIFFKFMVFFFVVFWTCGLLFPLFSPWVCFWCLLFVTSFSWLGSRTFTLASECFLVSFDKHYFWNWVFSLFMFISHLLGFVMSLVALIFRISIVFLVGHFLLFFALSLDYSFFLLLFIIPIEVLFAFLQSYIFLVMIRMFLLCMI